jgi:3',5'-cyclic AMP phosphodiesterase CpdA
LIWHISDLHIRGPSLTLGNGHCEILKNKFLEILESRNSYLKDDVIVISGDCTDDGSVESDQCFQKFVQSLVALGAVEERIIFVPGNHDSWNGAKRAVLSLRSYIGGFNKEENLLHKFQVYPKRSLPKMFSSFLEKPLLEKKVAINGKDICFVAINTAIPNEMARGVFPVVCSNPRSNSEIKIAIMHHHLIDECSKTTLDGDVVYKIKWMRVLNPAPALNYLFTNNFSISLHGHKHLQYHKRESQLNSSQAFVHLMSAPSLFEKKYDQNNGNITEDNFIGFNVMCPKEEGFDFFFFRLQNWNYCLKHQDTGKY